MKLASLLLLALTISTPIYANDVRHTSAPSSDETLNGQRTAQQEDYMGSDVIHSGQAATRREQRDDLWKSCRTARGTWVNPGDAGYVACVDSEDTIKK